ETMVRVQRSPPETRSTWTRVAILAPDATSHTDSGLTPSTSYTYRIRACNSDGCSTSNLLNVTTDAGGPPAAPTNLTATSVGTTEVALAWDDNADNETMVRVQRSPP